MECVDVVENTPPWEDGAHFCVEPGLPYIFKWYQIPPVPVVMAQGARCVNTPETGPGPGFPLAPSWSDNYLCVDWRPRVNYLSVVLSLAL